MLSGMFCRWMNGADSRNLGNGARYDTAVLCIRDRSVDEPNR
jgi:hypothetical protein